MLQIVHKNKICWCGNIKQVIKEIEKISQEYYFVKDFITKEKSS